MIFSLPSGLLRRTLAVPALVADTATINATDDGISITTVDPAHIMITGIAVPRTAMSVYDEPCDMTIDIKKAAKAASLAEKDEEILASCDGERLTMSFGPLTRTMGLLTSDTPAVKVPQLQYNSTLTVPASVLKEAIRAATTIEPDVVTFALADNGRLAITQDADTDDVEYIAAVSDAVGDSRASYPASYIQIASGMLPPDGMVKIEFGTAHPIRISFESEEMSGYALIAPTVKQGED